MENYCLVDRELCLKTWTHTYTHATRNIYIYHGLKLQIDLLKNMLILEDVGNGFY
jgi:hypothetical protein